ncbi:(2Fe-2S)-binding protein [Bacteroidota bacterium]
MKLKVNGKNLRLMIQPETTLVEILRDKLQLTGTKISCNNGECGGCTVLLDGNAVYSCHMLALDAAGKEVITIEGLMNGEELHPLQQAFIDEDGLQCGFCTPGQIMAAYALLLNNPAPTKDEITEAMSGNLCKCAAYPNIIKSVQKAAVKMK